MKDRTFLEKLLDEGKITQERYDLGLAKLNLKQQKVKEYKALKKKGKATKVSDIVERLEKLEEILEL